MATLDRKKPFGEIFGDDPVRRYEQDGVFFNALGEELDDKGNVVKAAPKKADEKKDAGAASVDAQLAKQ